MRPEVDTFLKTVLRSGLLNREQLRTALRDVPREQRGSPEDLAGHLIKAGKLSRFQASKLLEGATVGLRLGPYQVQAPIGRGGMGMVYLALDTRNSQYVALKVLPPHKAREEERYLTRFRREMELSQRVRHAHIALTYDVGESNGVHFIAMEYIPGMSLHRMVSRKGPISVARAARLFAEVCSGLDHAHSQGLIHRDLKPSNIMVTPNDHAKVLDLGLALMEGEVAGEELGKEAAVIGGQNYVVGSMDFIAPEQTEDATGVDARADIYSLGCSLYFALTGRQPFPGGTIRDKMRRHRTEEPEPVERLNRGVPDEFAGLVRKMMAKRPEARFASAYDARGALLPWAAGEPELPLDRPNDTTFREAVHALASADVSSELLGDVIILQADAAQQAAFPRPEPPSADEPILLDEPGPRRDYLWLIFGLIAFWLIVLIAIGVVAMLQ
jgi:serine/threonine protein kinase